MYSEGKEEAEIIDGISTICGLVGEPARTIDISFKDLKGTQIAMVDMNHRYIALVPYCFKCKSPLHWVRGPKSEQRIFVCKSCNRVWTKGEGWPAATKEEK